MNDLYADLMSRAMADPANLHKVAKRLRELATTCEAVAKAIRPTVTETRKGLPPEMTPNRETILRALNHYGPSTIDDLERFTGLTDRNLYQTIRNAERYGWFARTGRVYSITDHGRAVLNESANQKTVTVN